MIVFFGVKLALANNGIFSSWEEWSSGSHAEDVHKEVFLHPETGLMMYDSIWREPSL